MTTVDRLGRDADEFTTLGDGGRVPVITTAHRWQMVRDLYRQGWSFRLVGQAFGLDVATVLDWLNRREPPQ